MIENLVSCIVPTYNCERFVVEAIESILGQTYAPLEVICVDDGSTDGTRALLLKRFGDRIRYVHQQNAGPATARNTGARCARGEFLAFLDSDDTWVPDKLKIQVGRLREKPEHGFCVSHVQNFWEPELAEEQIKFQDHARSKAVPGYVTQALLVRATAFQKIGLFNTELKHTDAADWFMRAKACGVVGDLLADVLVLRRLHKDNRSRKHAGRSSSEFLEMAMAAVKRKRDQGRGGGSGESPNQS
jgi:glycosyltransferase involved in cell wall biosynthesis